MCIESIFSYLVQASFFILTKVAYQILGEIFAPSLLGYFCLAGITDPRILARKSILDDFGLICQETREPSESLTETVELGYDA